MADAAKVFGKDSDGDQLLLSHALKEWAIAIDALYAGDLIVLFRKGGISDPAQSFACPHPRILLFPTYEHQGTESLRIKNDTEIGEPEPDIRIRAWAQITHGFALKSPQEIDALMPFHIWTTDFIAERLKWRPQQPLQILCLRTYRLRETVRLVRSPRYSGCRSWITLETPISVDTLSPALSDEQYFGRLRAIEAALQCYLDFTLKSAQL
jgi:hypothetical protein